MNYRHRYHAGNICDVFKHTVLVAVLDHLLLKDSAFFVLDTHAGVGLYDLQSEAAQKTLEAQTGILTFAKSMEMSGSSEPSLPLVKTYYERVLSTQPETMSDGAPLQFYPGSPWIIAKALRSQDQLIACELHADDARDLRQQFYHQSNVHVHHRDGYDALRAFLPPPEKRGLVLIDPPYEETNEWQRLVTSVHEACGRWPQGTYMLWYPIKERPDIWRFHEALIATGIRKQLSAEFIYGEESRSDRLHGAGLIVVNPPWQLEDELARALPVLHKNLKTDIQKTIIKWLVPE